jgi:hypothetical protein
MSVTTFYAAALTAVLAVGTVFTIAQRYRILSLQETTFEGAIVELHLSSGFVFLTLVPFLCYIEISKRIQFINGWGIFQVRCFGLLYV